MKWDHGVLFAALVIGAVLRLWELDLRPMHTDEAVHAVKFGTLLETGVYRYDRNEYHGPTLNYFTLIPAWLSGEKSLADLTETTLRLVPALFGIALILLVIPLRGAGRSAAAVSASLIACSPTLSYYSRYYIQETLLVFFAFGLIVASYRFIVTGRISWALGAGLCGGLMVATKETWVISIVAMSVSLAAVHLIRRREGAASLPVDFRGVGAGVAVSIAVAVLFYSSFFTHWEGVRDSLLAYHSYFSRAADPRHAHSWKYFLRMLIWWQEGNGPVWTQMGILVLGVIGISASVFGKRSEPGAAKDVKIFLGIYAVLMFIIASAIPYKTPWLILGALLPLILMAGWGAVSVYNWLPARLRVPGVVLVIAIGGHLLWQSSQANFRYDDNPANPLVYSHPNEDVIEVATKVEDAVQVAPGDIAVQVAVSGDEYWPLPWYLRRLRRVGWWNSIDQDFVPTPVMLVSPDLEENLVNRIYEAQAPDGQQLYVPLFDRTMVLRPGKEIRGYVTLAIRDRMREGNE